MENMADIFKEKTLQLDWVISFLSLANPALSKDSKIFTIHLVELELWFFKVFIWGQHDLCALNMG